MRSTKIIKICSSSLCTCLHHMVILRTRNKITDFLMILAWASLFKGLRVNFALRWTQMMNLSTGTVEINIISIQYQSRIIYQSERNETTRQCEHRPIQNSLYTGTSESTPSTNWYYKSAFSAFKQTLIVEHTCIRIHRLEWLLRRWMLNEMHCI